MRAAWADDEIIHNEPLNAETSEPLSIPSLPKIISEWGYAGSRYQGPNRAFALQEASPYEEHIKQSSDLPFPMNIGHRILPGDLEEAISFIAHWGAPGIKSFRLKQLSQIQNRADAPTPFLHKLRATAKPSRESPRARLHAPLLKELLKGNGAGGSEWRDNFATGCPISGELREPGVFPPSNESPYLISREGPFASAPERFL